MRRTTMIATVFLFAAPTLVLGGTYQWRDDAGTVHFTDDSDRIPGKYLKRAQEVDAASAAKPAANAPKQEAPVAAPAARRAAAPEPGDPNGAQRERLRGELARIRGGLVGKKQELQKLHHKWMVLKGRTPTLEEAKKFQKDLAEGKTTDGNNPYVTKNHVFSTAGAARAAYYKKLVEVREDDAQLQKLERELEAMK
ncbi:DUF4124 domain-containing protein [Geomonas propionica]|uniref:DUF4124 domain-containing protein n=1 Tax=Geomonas propionica TaxID=2798582 RepID=A0ABS0YR28_9BACT|nr:DUF4124 domain-containing protein [Geomonas propionica]MBJ6800379.1 DUF4124 domain-containing protein [Geomonas propionica]